MNSPSKPKPFSKSVPRGRREKRMVPLSPTLHFLASYFYLHLR